MYGRFVKIFLILSVCEFLAPCAWANTVYVAFGDSITAGAMAATYLPDSPFSRPKGAGPTFTLRFFERKETLSWATGRLIQSFAKRLEESNFHKKSGGEFLAFNVARTGVPSEDLARQFELFKKELKIKTSGKSGDQLVATLLIGANDICQKKLIWGPLQRSQFRHNLIQLLNNLDQMPGFKSRKVLVSAIFRTSLLGEPGIKDARMFGNWTCHQVRDQGLKICPSLLVWNTQAEREQLDSVWGDINLILAALPAERWKKLEVAFSDAFGRQQPRSDYLAHDCFHPNLRGHGVIAQEMWATQPWF